MNPSRRAELRKILFAAQGGKCCYCECWLVMPESGIHKPAKVKDQHPRMATFEHLRRRAEGGKDDAGNLALACRLCNTARGTLSWVEFKTLVHEGVA